MKQNKELANTSKTCVSSHLASSSPIPSASSDTVAMPTFIRKITKLGTIISSNKLILQMDVTAPESTGMNRMDDENTE